MPKPPEARRMVIARLLLLRNPAREACKIIVPSLNPPLATTPHRIFNAHPLDVFGGAGQVIKQDRRPGGAMNFQVSYVEFQHARRARILTARRGIAARLTQLAIL